MSFYTGQGQFAEKQFAESQLAEVEKIGKLSLCICRILKGQFVEYIAFSNNVFGRRICPHFF